MPKAGAKQAQKVGPLGITGFLLTFTNYYGEMNMSDSGKSRWSLMNTVNQIAPYGTRLQKCHLVPVGNKISIVRNGAGLHNYHGLTECGNAWSCPICSQKHAIRKSDIARVVHWNLNRRAVMITYTLQHTKGEGLLALLNTLTMAHRVARTGRRLAEYNDLCLGYISSKEITWGRNGWHPHFHEVNYLHGEINLDRINKTLVRNYKAAIAKSGRIVNNITVRMDEWDGSTDYLTKGSKLSAELALGFKKAGNESLNIFDIIQRAKQGNKWADLFTEFYHATHRKKVVNFSRSLDFLRKRAEESADKKRAEVTGDSRVVHTMTREEWTKICKGGIRYNVIATLDGK